MRHRQCVVSPHQGQAGAPKHWLRTRKGPVLLGKAWQGKRGKACASRLQDIQVATAWHANAAMHMQDSTTTPCISACWVEVE